MEKFNGIIRSRLFRKAQSGCGKSDAAITIGPFVRQMAKTLHTLFKRETIVYRIQLHEI